MLGFTRQEHGIVIFLVFTLIVGSVVTLYKRYYGEIIITNVNSDYIDEFNRRAAEINNRRTIESNNSYDYENISNIDKQHPGEQVESRDQKYSSQTSHGEKNTSFNAKKNKFLINVNVANQDELQNIPRIGPVLAERIINYRTERGGFISIEELKKVKGIGDATYNKIKPYLSIK